MFLHWMVNMMNCFRAIIFLLVICFSSSSAADAHYKAYGENYSQELSKYHVLTSEDINNKPTINPLASELSAWRFQNIQGNRIPLIAGDNWLTFSISNKENFDQHVFLAITNSLHLTKVALYLQQAGQAPKLTALTTNRNNAIVSQLQLMPQANLQVFILLSSESAIEIPIELFGDISYVNEVREQEFFNGLSTGGSVFLAIGVLFLFFASGSKSILLLCGYFSARAIGLVVLLGSNLLYFFPEQPELRGLEIPIITAIIGLFLLWFTAELFALKTSFPQLYRWIKSACWLLLAYLPIGLTLSVPTNVMVCMLIHNIVTLLLVFIGFKLAKEKIVLARLFTTIMFIQFFMGLLVVINVLLFKMSLFDNNELLYSFSFSLNGMLLIFLVSRLFYVQVKEKEVAQKAALTSALQAKVAQDELFSLQEENQEQLETRVQERTFELNIAFQELENLNKELAAKTTTDDLTGLNNRRFYDQKLQAEFRRSRRNLTPLSLVILDIDHFKAVNDNFGHIAGDQCLVVIGRIIKSILRRSTDIGCRYGGEEFCIILPETSLQGAVAIAQELRKLVAENVVFYQDDEIKLTISCGVTVYEQQADVTQENIFEAADKALYQAKQAGRDNVQVFHLNH